VSSLSDAAGSIVAIAVALVALVLAATALAVAFATQAPWQGPGRSWKCFICPEPTIAS
jgi:hypothetical protein